MLPVSPSQLQVFQNLNGVTGVPFQSAASLAVKVAAKVHKAEHASAMQRTPRRLVLVFTNKYFLVTLKIVS